MRSHAVTFQSFCGYLLSGHREWGLSPEAASAGQDDEGRQSVSSLAALTLSIPETASSSQISGQTPYLHYQSSTNGEKGTPLPLDQVRGRTSSQHASRLLEPGGWWCLVLYPGVETQPGLAVQVPWEQQHCQQGAGKEARSWLCPPTEQERGLQKRWP